MGLSLFLKMREDSFHVQIGEVVRLPRGSASSSDAKATGEPIFRRGRKIDSIHGRPYTAGERPRNAAKRLNPTLG